MNLRELIDQFRSDNRDRKAKPYLWSDEDLITWFNEAECEAALRANLLFERVDSTICQIPVVADISSYPLHELVYFVERATFTATGSDEVVKLTLTDRHELDRTRPDWRTTTDEPQALIVDDITVELGCLPTSAGIIAMDVYRGPLRAMTGDEDRPEIGWQHHRFLQHWVEHKAYKRPDVETRDPGRHASALADFTRQFGIRPDANFRRAFQANTPLHNKAYF